MSESIYQFDTDCFTDYWSKDSQIYYAIGSGNNNDGMYQSFGEKNDQK